LKKEYVVEGEWKLNRVKDGFQFSEDSWLYLKLKTEN
jgi:hypothetical protein